jgi:Secretion system C-terminal sorting domain
MKKIYFSLAMLLLSVGINAQINYTFSASSGTYTPLVAPTAVTLAPLVGTSGTTDDGFRNAIGIGFSFKFNGIAYTRVNLCSNGFIGLGNAFVNTPASAPVYYSSADLAGTRANDTLARPIIAPFWTDLDVQTAPTGGMSYKTTGTTPNRVFTVQWYNALWDYDATSGSISFQVKLYETTNVIEFVYNQEAGIPESPVTNNPLNASIGIAAKARGLVSFMSLQDVTSAPAVSKLNEASIVATRPASGQIYRFTPRATAIDAAIEYVYTPASIATSADPQSMGTFLYNNGNTTITNVPVILSVSGANTFKDTFVVASLAAGRFGSLNFKQFASTNLGVNNITISVPSDSNNLNNTATSTQNVTSNTINYADPLQVAANGIGITGATQTFEVAAKITNPTLHNVNTLLASFFKGGRSFTATIYDATGTGGTPGGVLWSSAAPMTSVAGEMQIPVSPSVAITGDYFVAFSQADTTSFDYAYDIESPVNIGKFYFQSATSGGFFDTRNTTGGYFKLRIGAIHDIVLPIKLGNFTAKLENNSSKLTWNTLTEQSNKGFNVQRSQNGKSFTTIGFVEGKGNSNNNVVYNFIDAKPFAGENYYRLVQVDFNGKEALSNVVLVKNSAATKFELSATYPNPATTAINATLTATTSQKVTINVTDMAGKIVVTKSIETFVGNNTIQLATTQLASGSYLIKCVGANGEIATQKFVKQ